VTRRELVLVLGGFLASALVLTFPLVLPPSRTLPSDLGDTLLTTWIVSWDADRLRHGLRGLWDAPIFFPYRNTLAFSETLLGVAVFVAPVYWITADPVLTYNAAFLLSFVIAGIGMYLLTRELTGNRAAAFAAGMYYAFGPLRMSQISHIQLVATGWIPFALWGLHRYFSTRQFRWLAVFAASWVLQTLSNTYAGYFIAVPIAIVVVDGVVRATGARTRLLLQLAAAGLLVAAALAPAALAYYRARTSITRCAASRRSWPTALTSAPTSWARRASVSGGRCRRPSRSIPKRNCSPASLQSPSRRWAYVPPRPIPFEGDGSSSTGSWRSSR
jgi:hypothetical protein